MVAQNLEGIRQKIEAVCVKIGRNPGEITLVVVSKGVSVELIKEAVNAGIANIGENRIQEATLKYRFLTPNTQHLTPIQWHMIGHLQTNKVKAAVKIFSLIQSVDSLRLAQAIDKEARAIGKIQDIFVEVNTSGEQSKFGINPENAYQLFAAVSELKNINLKGLMTIGPLSEDVEAIRGAFRNLRRIKEEIARKDFILSMGMSSDYEIAIEEGANMIRLGRAIFAG